MTIGMADSHILLGDQPAAFQLVDLNIPTSLEQTGSEISSQSNELIQSNQTVLSAQPNYYNRLDEKDVDEARMLGLLRSEILVCTDANSLEYGVVIEKNNGTKLTGICEQAFDGQKDLQTRCKQFAMRRGFQLYVSNSSTRANGGGNVKYKCKKLHDQQFYDPVTPANSLECPFYINGFGKGRDWKITRACFLHNHYKFIGWRPSAGGTLLENSGERKRRRSPETGEHLLNMQRSVDMAIGDANLALSLSDDSGVENSGLITEASKFASTASPSISQDLQQTPKRRAQRNTTFSTKALCNIVTETLRRLTPSHVAISSIDGRLIKRILLSQGHTINHMMASRIKARLRDKHVMSVRESFQKLGTYLSLVANANPGSLYQVETVADRCEFHRALFIPSATIHALPYCRRIISIDIVQRTGRKPQTSSMDIERHLFGRSVFDDEIPVDLSTAQSLALFNPVQHSRVNTPTSFGTSGYRQKISTLSSFTPSRPLDDDSEDALCGVYLKAMTKDINDHLITFAVALVVQEMPENWDWFLSAIASSHPVQWSEYTVIAGRRLGLEQAIATHFPGAAHHFCVRSLLDHELPQPKTSLSLWSNVIRHHIYSLARSDSEGDFQQKLNSLTKHLKDENIPEGPTILKFLAESLNRSQWVKHAFLDTYRRPTFDEITTDMTKASEFMSNTSGRSWSRSLWEGQAPARSSQPVETFQEYFSMLANSFQERRALVSNKSPIDLVPYRLRELEEILRGSQQCESITCAGGAYMVRHLTPIQQAPENHPHGLILDAWRHVNLVDWDCTCQRWQDQLFPCVHAIHAAELEQRRVDSLYPIDINIVETYQMCYKFPFHLISQSDVTAIAVDESMNIALDLLYQRDPNVKRKPGPRPKKKLRDAGH